MPGVEPSTAEFIQWGVLGLVLLLIIMGKLVPGWAHDQLRKDYDDMRAENAAMRKSIEERVIPALEKSTVALASAASALPSRKGER